MKKHKRFVGSGKKAQRITAKRLVTLQAKLSLCHAVEYLAFENLREAFPSVNLALLREEAEIWANDVLRRLAHLAEVYVSRFGKTKTRKKNQRAP